MHGARRQGGRGAHGTAYLLAHRLGIDGRAPFDQRLVDGELIDALAQADLVGWPRVGVGDGDQRGAVEKGMSDAVDHIGRAGSARGEAHAGATGDLAPGGRQHSTSDLLLHQQEAHLALSACLHQLDRLAPGMPDDKRGASFLERVRKHLHGRGHAVSSRVRADWEILYDICRPHSLCAAHAGAAQHGSRPERYVAGGP
jgi:hypothetical protein